MKNSDLPAMPMSNQEIVTAFMEVEKCSPNGLTKREYFAGLAMQNILSTYNPFECGDFDSSDYDAVVTHSIGLADALLKALGE